MDQPDPQVNEIDVQQAAARAKDALLLDVREEDEWAAGHAPDAEHRPLSSLDPRAVPTDRPVLAICRSGNRSGQAAQALAAAGVDVVNVAGGMKAWQQAGLPMTSSDGSAPQVL